MEFVARKTDLLRELSILQGLAAPSHHLPILSHVWLEAEEGQVRFAATNLEVGLKTSCTAQVTTTGVLALPARSFYDIVRSFPDVDVRVIADEKGAMVSAEKFDGHMVALPAGDFPQLPEPVTPALVTLDRAAMREMAGKVMFAMSSDDARYFLDGALLILTPTLMTMVATDGHRLAIVTKPREAEEGAPAEVRTLLSRKTLGELLRLIGDPTEPTFSYAVTPEHLFFHVGTSTQDPTNVEAKISKPRLLIARIVDAQFPVYDKVIPKDLPTTIEFNRDLLVTAVRRVALLADGRTRAVKLTFKKGKACEVTAASPERGDASEPLPCDYTEKKPLTLCFNAQYLLEGLAACATDGVALGMKDEISQVLLSPIGAKGFTYTYVLMPMRI